MTPISHDMARSEQCVRQSHIKVNRNQSVTEKVACHPSLQHVQLTKKLIHCYYTLNCFVMEKLYLYIYILM